MKKNNIIKSTEDCLEFGKIFSEKLTKGNVVGLIGNLASGKTTFVKGVMLGLGFKYTVSSPTFTLINNYDAKLNVNHVDFYREPNIDRWKEIGFEELVYNSDLVLVEWADLIPDIMPKDTLYLKFEHIENNFRKISVL